MIGRFDDEAALATDAYIDLLLDGPERAAATPAHARRLDAQLSATIDLLAGGLPRFHPSFSFEERLAARLRRAGAPAAGELVRLPPPVGLTVARLDRRVIIGGAAIAASGVSMAAVAWLAGRRGRPLVPGAR
jgi:hypothetical protein